MNAMGVEADAPTTDWERHEQVSVGREDAAEFGEGLSGSVGIQLVAVTAQSDMLDDVKARQGSDRLVRIGQRENVSLYRLQLRHLQLERSNVDECHGELGGKHCHEDQLRPNIYVLVGRGREYAFRSPSRLLKVV